MHTMHTHVRMRLHTPSDVHAHAGQCSQGHLEFARKDLQLDCNYIFVMGGSLKVGSEEEPFEQQATITLRGGRLNGRLATRLTLVLTDLRRLAEGSGIVLE